MKSFLKELAFWQYSVRVMHGGSLSWKFRLGFCWLGSHSTSEEQSLHSPTRKKTSPVMFKCDLEGTQQGLFLNVSFTTNMVYNRPVLEIIALWNSKFFYTRLEVERKSVQRFSSLGKIGVSHVHLKCTLLGSFQTPLRIRMSRAGMGLYDEGCNLYF
jgi:hypothetical protein